VSGEAAGVGLIADTSFYPDPRYTFRHPLIHEVAYGGLVHARRHALHARALEAIERLHPTRLSQHTERLAHHAFCSEVWDKAVEYAGEAGTKAAESSAYREAVVYLEQAIAALAHLPEDAHTLARAIDLRLALRSSLFPLGQIPRDLEHLSAAEPLARRLGDRSRLAWILAHMVRDLALLGKPERALEEGARALAVAEDVRDTGLEALVRAYLGLARQAMGEYRSAAELLRASVRSLGDDRVYTAHGFPGPASVFVRAWLAWVLTELGEFSDASGLADDALRVATAADQPLSLAVAHYTRGNVHVGRGDLTQAQPPLEQSFELCRVWHLVAWLPRIAAALGHARVLSGRVAEGLALLESTLQPTRLSGFELRRPLEAGFLAHAYLRAGRLDDAWRWANDAVALATAARERGHEAYAHRLLGEIAAHLDPPDVETGERHYRQALARANELSMRPLVAHCHLGLGTLHRRTDEREQAHEHLTTATTMYGEMGMSFWLEKAETALRALD
jgi:tetratricopeptide (TPR) repeat protein